MSNKRIQANRANARKSTGPKTAAGKRAIARNGLKHGILSRALFLDDEDPEEFAALCADLENALRPSGPLESALVEKLAVALWRQQRLIRAETAMLEQQRRPQALAYSVGKQLDRAWDAPALKAADLEPMDAGTLEWCRAALSETSTLAPAVRDDWHAWETAAPVHWAELQNDAAEGGQSPDDYLAEEFDGRASDYLQFVTAWCRTQLDKAEQSDAIQAVVRLVRDERAIPSGVAAQTLGRYADMLDRELYKALKALRETQAWRLENLEVVPTEPETVSGDSRAALSAV